MHNRTSVISVTSNLLHMRQFNTFHLFQSVMLRQYLSNKMIIIVPINCPLQYLPHKASAGRKNVLLKIWNIKSLTLLANLGFYQTQVHIN